jgi:uncharacterized membrane protein YhdT
VTIVFALIAAVFAFLAGTESGKLGADWWQALSPTALPFFFIAVAFFFFAVATVFKPKPLSHPWRYEMLMVGACFLLALSVVYAATHPTQINEQLVAFIGIQTTATLIIVVLFFVLKSDKSWKLAIPALLLFIASIGILGYAFLG